MNFGHISNRLSSPIEGTVGDAQQIQTIAGSLEVVMLLFGFSSIDRTNRNFSLRCSVGIS